MAGAPAFRAIQEVDKRYDKKGQLGQGDEDLGN
jgi:hypothetical protein